MTGPSVWTAILADPTVPFDRDTLMLVVADQRRPSRRWLYPVVRPLSRLAVGLIRFGRRLLPVRLSAHSTMDGLCVWFLSRFVSPAAGAPRRYRARMELARRYERSVSADGPAA